jgi:hypothetical protein
VVCGICRNGKQWEFTILFWQLAIGAPVCLPSKL